jgi:hypothetical protein
MPFRAAGQAAEARATLERVLRDAHPPMGFQQCFLHPPTDITAGSPPTGDTTTPNRDGVTASSMNSAGTRSAVGRPQVVSVDIDLVADEVEVFL